MPRIIDHIVILTLPFFKNIIFRLLEKYGEGLRYNFVFNQEELNHVVTHDVGEKSLLISFGTGVLVRKELLDVFLAAYNFHPASPDYPGLDPHHFAIYDDVCYYGATCHVMEEKVDRGAIVVVERFPVEGSPNAMELLEMALLKTFDLVDKIFCVIFEKNALPQPCGEVWSHRLCTKAQRLQMCHMALSISEEEFQKVYHAFQEGVERKNLTIELHGHLFRYEGKIS